MSGTVLPIIRQCCYTPLRDILRAQLTGRLDWRLKLRQSGLPEDVQTTIFSVVKKSRLFRLEKVEVCDELIGRFEDGQRAGSSCEQLLNDFGDLTVAANLIGRSKKRNRSLFLKIGRAAGYLGLGLIASYVAMTVYFWLGQANPNIDFLVDLNKVAINEKDENRKAWPIYRETWIKYDALDYQKNQRLQGFSASDENGELLKPTDAEWPRAVAFLTDYREMLDAYREAGKRPVLGLKLRASYSEYDKRDLLALFPGFPDDSGKLKEEYQDTGTETTLGVLDGSLVGILLPHIHEFRNIARMLTVDTRLAVEENDPERALQNIKTTFAVANHAAEMPFLVCGLVAHHINGIAFDMIEETVDENPDFFSEEQLKDLQSVVAGLPIRQQIQLDGARAMTYDIIQRIYTDDGNGDGRMTMNGAAALDMLVGVYQKWNYEVPSPFEIIFDKVASPARMFTVASRKEMKQKYDELMDEAEQAFDQPISKYEPQFGEKLHELPTDNKYKLLGIVMFDIEPIRQAMEVQMTRRDATELALASERFRKSTGKLPNTAKELVPEFIDALPIDPLTGGPLGLKSEHGELKIYSVANNLHDDGGEPLTVAKTGDKFNNADFRFQSADTKLLNGDWILWPHREN